MFKFLKFAVVCLTMGILPAAANGKIFERDDVRTVVFTGDPIPGEPFGVYMSLALWNPALNDTGQVAFRTTLEGPRVDTSNAVANHIAILRGDPDGNLQLVARQREILNDGHDTQIRWLQDPQINRDGTTTFGGSLVGDTVISSDAGGLFRQVDASPAQLILQSNDTIIVHPGQGNRTHGLSNNYRTITCLEKS